MTLRALTGRDGGRTIPVMRILALIAALSASLLVGACRNPPAEERAKVLSEVNNSTEESRPEVRRKLLATLLGSPEIPRSNDPHLRATSAQGLGEIGEPEDFQPLLEALLGPFSDDNTRVRMEAAIALGKLQYPSAGDRRRLEVMRKLVGRLVFDRDEKERLLEDKFLVRSAMINSIVALGGRDAAASLHDVALGLIKSAEDPALSLSAGPLDAGLFDQCLDGLIQLTGVPREDAEAKRAQTDDNELLIAWWSDQIAAMK